MLLKLKCKECGTLFDCYRLTTRIYGPIVWTRCPECNTETERNMSAFVEEHVDSELQLISKACSMIEVAKYISASVGEQRAYSKKKKKNDKS